MPWSAIPKFPQIMKNLRDKGYTHQVGGEILRTEIKRVTYISGDKTISHTVKDMCDLGFIKDTGRGYIFYVYQGKPGVFPDVKKEAEDEVDSLLDNYGKGAAE